MPECVESMQTRREFAKTVGLGTIGLGLAPSLLTARQLSSPFPPVKDPKYRNWSEDALREAKRLGCTYADIRFTLNSSSGVAVRNGRLTASGNIQNPRSEFACGHPNGLIAIVPQQLLRGGGRDAIQFGDRREGDLPVGDIEALAQGFVVAHRLLPAFVSELEDVGERLVREGEG